MRLAYGFYVSVGNVYYRDCYGFSYSCSGMKFWWFDWFFWLVAFWVRFSLSFFLFVVSWVFSGISLRVCGFVSSYICFDVASLYLVVLTLLIFGCVLVLSP